MTFSLSAAKENPPKNRSLQRKATYELKTKYPLELTIAFTHNHSINSANALRYRPVSLDTKKRFIELFNEQHSPSSAFARYKKDVLEGKNSLEAITIMADRSIVPDYFWVFYFHQKYMDEHHGPQTGPKAYEIAQERVRAYNERHKQELASITMTESGNVVVAVCDEFSRRVHETLPQAGDIMLVDATSNLDRHDTKLFHLVSPTPVGGLPLGTLITTKEDEATIDAAMAEYKKILPKKAFFGRGANVGPKIVMSDDDTAERNALSKIWPDATLLLCIFHLLQALWRWLWDSTHKIDKCDRPTIFNLFKDVLYAMNENQFKEMKKKLLGNRTVKKYQNLLDHMNKDILPRKDEWSLVTRFKNNYSTNNVNTTNYAEVSFRITKENQFGRVKAYSFAELLDIVLDDSAYYVQRCIDIGNNRTSQFQNQKSRYLAKKCNIDVSQISEIDNSIPNSFLVPSEYNDDKFYEVKMDLRLCECPQGMLRGPCKHKQVVCAQFDIATPDVIPSSDSVTDCKLRAFYHFVATGTMKDMNWYRPLSHGDELKIPDFDGSDIFSFMRVCEEENDQVQPEKTTQDTDDVLSVNGETDPPSPPQYVAYDSDGERLTGEDKIQGLSKEELIEYFENSVQQFTENVKARIHDDFEYYEKAILNFTKNVQTVQKSTPGMFTKAMYTFTKETHFTAKKGRKSGRHIGVNNTHKSRRAFKVRGSGSAPKGRPTKLTQPKKRSGEPTACVLPAKVRKTKHPRNLSKAVAANRAAEKKH